MTIPLWIGTYANGHAYGQLNREACVISYGPYLLLSPVRIGTFATQRGGQ